MTLREKLRHATLRKVLKSLINRTESIVWALYRRLSGLHLYRYYISSGNNPCIDVHINHPDWELYRQMRSEPSLINNPYALFLDEFYPLHPDTQYHNRGEKTGDVKTYQSSLCRFFDHLEIPIVIAAHPKAEYSPDTFGSGREIIKYRSAQLVSHAEAVFMHNTASAAFVIMNDRPLALITNDSYNRQTTLRIAQQRLAKILDLEIYNIDQCDPTNIKLRHIDDEIRRNYIYSYLTTPQVENTPNIEILDKFFRSL